MRLDAGSLVNLLTPSHLASFATSRTLAMLVAAALAGALAGCTPKIGDGCFTSTDCSQRGDRLCDTAQPGGYCTLFACGKNGCPDDASCVLFDPQVPGCARDDRAGASGARTARSACMKWCEGDSDCRDGYVCADPRMPPWNAVILDDDQGKRSCLVLPNEGLASVPGIPSTQDQPNVCKAEGPAAPPIDASAPLGADAGAPAKTDAGPADAGPVDAGSVDAGDGGVL